MWASQTKLNREGDSKERGTWKQKKIKKNQTRREEENRKTTQRT